MKTQTELENFATEWLNAWHGNNPDKLLKYYADNALYADPAKRNGLKGKEQIKPYFQKLLAANPKWIWTVTEVMPTPKGFTLKWSAQIPVGKIVINETGLDIVEVENALITRNEVWFDRLSWMALLQAK